MKVALALAVGYVLGSMPWGYWLPLVGKRMDIRRIGSGNVGAANVWRAFGLRWGLAVALLDVAKGAAAAGIGIVLAGEVGGVLGGVAALLGHWRPVFLRFARGGKVVATTAGVTLALAPLAALAAALVWVGVFLLGRYSSLASLAGALALPPLAYAFGADPLVLGFTVGATIAILILHRSNVVRLLSGKESRFRLGRRTAVLPRRAGAVPSQE